MTKKIEEQCDGCDGGYDYVPVDEFDGSYGEPEEYTAVPSPSNVAVAQPVAGPNISVYLKDTEQSYNDSNGVDSSDLVEFTLNFVVSTYSNGSGSSRSYSVKKKIVVSKQSLLSQGIMIDAHTPATMVENKTVSDEKPANKHVFNRTSDLKRAREIAGVPHHKNYI